MPPQVIRRSHGVIKDDRDIDVAERSEVISGRRPEKLGEQDVRDRGEKLLESLDHLLGLARDELWLYVNSVGKRMTKAGRLRVGTSGYHYAHWRGVFYPEELREKEWLDYYVTRFDTVEINNTFYHLPTPEAFDHWREHAPVGFCYALKFSRYGSHIKRLKDPAQPIKMFLGRARRLKEFLGPILVQLPPRWGVNPERLAGFLRAAPRRCRWAFEFRDQSWLCEEVYALLRAHDAALCIHDMLADHPRKLTAHWTYLRFHGTNYSGCYSRQALAREAEWIRGYLKEGLDVYAYFNNDAEGYAPRNALDLLRFVKS